MLSTSSVIKEELLSMVGRNKGEPLEGIVPKTPATVKTDLAEQQKLRKEEQKSVDREVNKEQNAGKFATKCHEPNCNVWHNDFCLLWCYL